MRPKPFQQPTRHLQPRSEALPAFGPEATGLTPRVKSSAFCSWCGCAMQSTKTFRICPQCDTP